MAALACSSLTRIGPYEILDQLGRGAMGEVYKARHESSGDIVAIKVLSATYSESAKARRRFTKELRAACAINHPNMVRGMHLAEEGERPYFVMEFVAGETLGACLARVGRLPEAEAVGIAIQVAEGLTQAHSLHIIHRDIKPDNILLTPDGRAKLTDLSLAKDVDSQSELTVSGASFGTPHFMSPEQLRDSKHVDVRCDIYALAATLYVSVTGMLPFHSKNFFSIFTKKATNEVTPPRELLPTLSQELDAVICKAMCADRDERHATCADLIAALRATQQPAPEERPRALGLAALCIACELGGLR